MAHTYEEASRASIAYFGGETMPADVTVSKYLLRSPDGSLLELTPDDMHRRLAREIARVERNYPNPLSEDEVYDLFKGFKRVCAQGSPMSAIGNPYQVQSLSNCFVIPSPNDSYGSIARADEEILQIQKRRGGVGVDLSNIRPTGLVVNNAARTSDGVGIFMERYSNTTREVAQGGRRGALMETLDLRHPDIETFIDIKQTRDAQGNLSKVTGANVSVRVPDEFMSAVEADGDFTLRWPVCAPSTSWKASKVIKARDLWRKMMHAAWASAEPGVLYWDTVCTWSMADEFADKGFRTICTNPCSELPLSAYDACRLLLLNVLTYVVDPFLPSARFDYDAFARDVRLAQRLMDDVVDLEIEAIDRIIAKVGSDPEPCDERQRELALWTKIKASSINGRRTGTGLTAIGDAIAALGLRYGDRGSIDAVEEIYRTLAVNAHASSVQLAKERGAFPAWEPGRYIDNQFAQRLRAACPPDVNLDFDVVGRRNIALTTTAPCGSVSVLTQTTSGIEPTYRLQYRRRKKLTADEVDHGARVDFTDPMGDKWQEYDVFHPGLKAWMEATGNARIEESPYWKATAGDVDWLASIELLAAAQRWTEHSISKTVNLPSTATEDLVSDVYFKAWKLGIKGVTVYRDGSRSGVLLDSTGEKETSPRSDRVVDHHAPRRPKELPCDIHRVSIKGEQYLVLVGTLGDRPYEVFAGLREHIEIPRRLNRGVLVKNGKKDGVATYNLRIPLDDDELLLKDIVTLFDNPEHGALTRMVSLSMRHGVPIQFLVEQLKKDRHSDLQSFSAVVARVLKTYIKDGTPSSDEKLCPECGGSTLVYQQGCVSCVGGSRPDGTTCSWSRC